MNSARQVLVAAVVSALIMAGVAHAQDVDLDRLLGRLPGDCLVVAGTSDFPGAANMLRQGMEAAGVGSFRRPMRRVAEWLGKAPSVLRGPAVAALLEGGGWLFVAETSGGEKELSRIFGGGEEMAIADNAIVIGPGEHPDAFFAVEGGLLLGASTREDLESLRSSPRPVGGSFLDSVGHLSGVVGLQDATCFVYARLRAPQQAANREEAQWPSDAIRQRLKAAFASQFARAYRSLSALYLEEDSVRVRGVSFLSGEEKRLPEVVGWQRKQAPSLARSAAVSCRGDGADFGRVLDWLGSLMEGFDPDVAAEYKQELSELNRELGFDFQADFLGALGPEWGLRIMGTGEENRPRWAFTCGLNHPESFVRRARRLVPLQEKERTGGKGEGAAHLFSAHVFGLPFNLAVTPDRAVLAPSDSSLREILELDESMAPRSSKETGSDGGPAWELHCVIRPRRFEGFVPRGRDYVALRRSLGSLPEGARAFLHLRRQDGMILSEVSVENVTPPQMAAIVAAAYRVAMARL